MAQKNIQRGDIWHLDLEPTIGREQKGKRFCLVVSHAKFNSNDTVWIVPITSGGESARMRGFSVSLENEGLKTKGVILCHQLRTVDLLGRGGKYVERVSDEIMEEVSDIISTIMGA
jgi:mRNA-degrading endonuclease toxin of MazEF toxin-antitoxin module